MPIMDLIESPSSDAIDVLQSKAPVLLKTIEIAISPPLTHQLTPHTTGDADDTSIMSAHLLGQPAEVLHEIFLGVEPVDLAALRLTCSYLHRLVDADERLWQLHHERIFVSQSQEGTSVSTDKDTGS
jgi:hypothetical protein